MEVPEAVKEWYWERVKVVSRSMCNMKSSRFLPLSRGS
jgi:hypothetical protein